MKKLMIAMILAFSISTNVMAGNVTPVKTTNLIEWLSKNLNYPTAAAQNKEEGIVYVSFTISENGKAEHIKVEKGISQALDNEAVKAVKNMPLEHLFITNGINKSYTLPVRFSIR